MVLVVVNTSEGLRAARASLEAMLWRGVCGWCVMMLDCVVVNLWELDVDEV